MKLLIVLWPASAPSPRKKNKQLCISTGKISTSFFSCWFRKRWTRAFIRKCETLQSGHGTLLYIIKTSQICQYRQTFCNISYAKSWMCISSLNPHNHFGGYITDEEMEAQTTKMIWTQDLNSLLCLSALSYQFQFSKVGVHTLRTLLYQQASATQPVFPSFPSYSLA